MSWIYILKLNNDKCYVGTLTNLPQRIKYHNEGMSNYTSKFLPAKPVFKKSFNSIKDARKMELKKLSRTRN